MTERFGDYVNDAWEDEDDWDDEEWDETLEERPREMEATFGLRGFLVVPGEYADDEMPEDGDDGLPCVDWPMTKIWRYCPACGSVDIAFPDGTFLINECEHCSMIPF